jgi:ABC-type glycerol-3-phosphate transport system substrate-binding protein
MRFVGLMRGTLAGLFLTLCAAPAFAVTEVEVWHSMTGVSADTFGALVQKFNDQQSRARQPGVQG